MDGYISETSTFLRTPKRKLLIGDEALEHFDQAARFFARHHGGHVNLRENTLEAERLRQQDAAPDIFPHLVDGRRQLWVGEPFGEQVERLQNRQPGADQRDELLVKDQEFLKI